MYLGFAVAGLVGGFTAKYLAHHLYHNTFVIVVGGLAIALVTFIAYVYFLTKIGK